MPNPTPKNWSDTPEKGNLFVLRLCLWLYRLLGRGVFLGLMSVIIFWYWLFSPRTRRASLAYLHRVHTQAGTHSPFDSTPSLWHTYRHLHAFGRSICDKIHGWSGGVSESQLHLFGHEHIRRHYGKGAVILVSHFGNIELLRAIKSDHSQQVNVLVYNKHASAFNAFLQSVNPKAGVRLISVDDMGVDTAIVLQERLDAGEWVIIASDRVPVRSERKQAVMFLGEQAYFPEGAWHLAHLLSAPVVAVFCYELSGAYELHIHPLSDDLRLPKKARQAVLHAHIQDYAHVLESHCLHAPYQWFNFYDFWQK